jgi:DNA-directed RNA polymerase subunit RPC12/RpoP
MDIEVVAAGIHRRESWEDDHHSQVAREASEALEREESLYLYRRGSDAALLRGDAEEGDGVSSEEGSEKGEDKVKGDRIRGIGSEVEEEARVDGEDEESKGAEDGKVREGKGDTGDDMSEEETGEEDDDTGEEDAGEDDTGEEESAEVADATAKDKAKDKSTKGKSKATCDSFIDTASDSGSEVDYKESDQAREQREALAYERAKAVQAAKEEKAFREAEAARAAADATRSPLYVEAAGLAKPAVHQVTAQQRETELRMEYLCAECDRETGLRTENGQWQQWRCRHCSCRILLKKRTKNIIQVSAT